jgi:hypothetical protein
MWGTVLFEVLFAALLVATWYFGWREFNRRQAKAIVGRIESAISGRGCISALQWQSASRFAVELRISPAFRDSFLTVQLMPREMPLSWLKARLSHQWESATFYANLDRRLPGKLVVATRRWFGSTNRGGAIPDTGYSLGSLVITAREDWQNETAIIEALVAARSQDLVEIEFREKSPNLVVTAPLQSLCAESEQSGMFQLLHELASCAAAKRR